MKKILLSLLLLSTSLFAESLISTAKDQSDLSLTVYNNGRAVVSEKRKVELPQGISTLRYSDIAQTVMANTIVVENLKGATILEQNYEYDLISSEKLIEKYVGKDVMIVRDNEYTGKSEKVKARILSANNGDIVLEIDGKIVLNGFRNSNMELDKMPKDLYATPTMNWLIYNPKSGKKNIAVNYLAQNIKWSADYVLNLASDSKSATLTGWVTMNNNSGTAYKDAKLKLVAGNVNVVQSSQRNRNVKRKAMASEEMSFSVATPVQQKSFFEYHLYTFPRKITVNNNQQKQLSLLNAENIKTNKKYRVTTNSSRYSMINNEKSKLIVDVNISFKTGKENNLDLPIPAGAIRLYQKDDDGGAIFIGGDQVNHTPINEEISLRIGEAFDIVATYKQTKFEKISKKKLSSTNEVELKNHKKEDIVVEVLVPTYGLWKLKNSPKYRKLNANLIAFDVKVPASGKATLNYTIVNENY